MRAPRSLVVLIAVACALPAVALAASHRLRDGRFRGVTSEHRAVRLAIVGSGRRVTFTIPWRRIAGRHCRPRGAYVDASSVYDRSRGAAIRADRTFAERIRSRHAGARGYVLHYDVRVSGRFSPSGGRVAGAMRVGVRFTRRGHDRTVASCSRRVAFSAARA